MIEPAPARAIGFLFVPRGRDHRPGELEADGHAVDREVLAVAVVGLHQRADAPAARRRRDAVPVPPLNSWQIMPVPPPTLALARRARPTRSRARRARAPSSTCIPLMSFSAPS